MYTHTYIHIYIYIVTYLHTYVHTYIHRYVHIDYIHVHVAGSLVIGKTSYKLNMPTYHTHHIDDIYNVVETKTNYHFK